MKKLISTALMIIPALGWAQSNTYTVKGQFKMPVSGNVYIQYYKDGKTQRDSTIVKNGLFELKGSIEGPQQVYMSFVNSTSSDKRLKGRDARSLYLDKGVVLISCQDSIKTAVISGVPINADYQRYQAIGKTDEALNQFVKQNPNSYFSLQAIQKIGGSYFDVAKVEPLFNALSPQLKSSKEGKAFAASIAAGKSTEVGKTAPDFTQMNIENKPVSLSDFRGKYVLVDFWASWCGPCRAENPKVLKAYNAYKDKNFTVLGVSVDQERDRDKWLKAIKDDGMPWVQLVDPNHDDPKGAGNLYAIKAIPSNFLINPQGKIVAKNLRGEALEKKLAELL